MTGHIDFWLENDYGLFFVGATAKSAHHSAAASERYYFFSGRPTNGRDIDLL